MFLLDCEPDNDFNSLDHFFNDRLVKKIPRYERNELNNPILHKVEISVDWIIDSLRDFYLKGKVAETRLKTKNFSSSILISRGMLFLDRAHSTKNVDEITNYVHKNTITAEDRSIIKNINESTIPRLEKFGLVELSKDHRFIDYVMPYPVSSKYFVYKNMRGELYQQQINQFTILSNVQDFPEPRNELVEKATKPYFFERDYLALSDIDVIRDKVYSGITYTVAKDYIMNNKESIDIWKTVLDAGSNVRKSFKDLMALEGEFGGFVTSREVTDNLGWKPRMAYKMFRKTQGLGLAKLTRTLGMEDALSRPIRGSKLTLNYQQLNNAQSILMLCRSIPDSIGILDDLYRNGELLEDDLLTEYSEDTSVVGATYHHLSEIGVLDQEKINDGVWSVAKNKECEDFLFEVTAIATNSRRILEAKGTQKKLSDWGATFIDDATIDTDVKKLQEDYDKEFGLTMRK